MAKLEWGIKRVCQAQSCGALFYDFRRSPITCPKCGTVFDPEAVLKSRRNRMPMAEELPPDEAEAAVEKPVAETSEDDIDSDDDAVPAIVGGASDDEDDDNDIPADTLLEDSIVSDNTIGLVDDI